MINIGIFSFNLYALLSAIGMIILKLVVILVVYSIVKSIGNKVISRLFSRAVERQGISLGRAKTLEKLIVNAFTYALTFFLIVMVLENVFGVQTTAILAGAGVVGLAIGFGAQGLVSDVVTGFFLLLEKQVDVDDYVTTAGFSGIVEEVGLRTTKIRDFDGSLHFVPNREITKLSNHSRGNMLALVDIGVTYDKDIDKAVEVMQRACAELTEQEETIKEGPNVVAIQGLRASNTVIRIIAKTETMQQRVVERKIRKAINAAFDANGMNIPFPDHIMLENNVE